MIPEERLAKEFHEAYERLAPQFGYETRKESAKPWEEVPEQNKRLMVAVCAELLASMLKACPDEATKFLLRASRENARVVSTGDLHSVVITEMTAKGCVYVDPETNLGWALIPWELSTIKDRKREADYFSRNNMMV